MYQNYMLNCDGRDCWVFLAQDTRDAQKVIRQARQNGLSAKVMTFRPVSEAEIARHFGRPAPTSNQPVEHEAPRP